MKTVQMTIDESMLTEVDQVIQSFSTTRSAFIRDALQLALRQYRIGLLEQQHVEGYARCPETAIDVAEWEAEQAWGDQSSRVKSTVISSMCLTSAGPS